MPNGALPGSIPGVEASAGAAGSHVVRRERVSGAPTLPQVPNLREGTTTIAGRMNHREPGRP